MRVRDAAYDVLRHYGLTRIFGNPGSSEIPFLTDFPVDFEYVLGLHEGAIVGVASGYALGTGRPAFVNLHTAAGLGNAVNAIVCARDNRIPLVIAVGQQDRRQLALQPFLTGRSLERLAGDYPVWSTQPAHPADVPSALARAVHEAAYRRGPALVVVPMGDWDEELPGDGPYPAAPAEASFSPSVSEEQLRRLEMLLDAAARPALVVGAGIDTPAGWRAITDLAERLACPVWQDTFSSRAGFPQDHPLFAGHLSWRRSELRGAFAGHDLVLAVGTPAFRLYLYEDGRLVHPGTAVAVVSDDPDEAFRSPSDLAVVASPALVCAALAARAPQRSTAAPRPFERPSPPAPAAPLRAEHLVAALAARLPRDAALFEEAPSTRPEILARIPIRVSTGFVAVANGALGFGLAGAIGMRMATPDRPVVALLGDGSATYTIQALWTAAHYRVGVVVVIVGNGRYQVMDGLADAHGAPGAWPTFDELDLATIARGFGCDAERIETHEQLERALDDVLANQAGRDAPLLLDVRVAVPAGVPRPPAVRPRRVERAPSGAGAPQATR
jgi:benzoylformate decarboxylase